MLPRTHLPNTGLPTHFSLSPSSQYLHFQPCFFGKTVVGGEKNILVFNLSLLQLSATEMKSGAKRQAPPSPGEEALMLHFQLSLQEKNMHMLTHEDSAM